MRDAVFGLVLAVQWSVPGIATSPEPVTPAPMRF